MKKLAKFFMFFALVLSVGLSLTVNVSAAETSTQISTLEGELIYYYREGSETDVLRTLDSIKKLDETRYNRDQKIIDYWKYVDNTMTVNTDVAADGLDNTSTLAIVGLGYNLKDYMKFTDDEKEQAAKGDLTVYMEDELKGRCDVIYNTAMKYTNAKVYVTGGLTSVISQTGEGPNAKTTAADVSEGQAMAYYLENEKGLDTSRIVTEDASANTVQNAEFTFEKLTKDGMKTMILVTSDYHVRRGCLLFYAESLITAEEDNTDPITIVSNAGWNSGKSTEGVNMEAMSLAQQMDVSLPGQGRPGEATTSTPEISTLTDLAITVDSTKNKGDALNAKVTATYSIDNYTRDVTDLATITGYDANTTGSQTITATYKENDVEKTATATVNVVDNSVKQDEKTTTATTENTQSAATSTTETAKQDSSADSGTASTTTNSTAATSADSDTTTTTTLAKPAKPVIKTSIASNLKKITVQWNKVANATAYQIAYKKNSASKYTTIKVTGTKYSISTKKNDTISIKVRAVNNNVYSKYSTVKNRYISSTAIQSLTKATKAFTTKVSKASDATGYSIIYSTKANVSAVHQNKMKKGANNTAIKVTKLSKKKKYYVMARTYKKVNGTNYYGRYTAVKTVTTK